MAFLSFVFIFVCILVSTITQYGRSTQPGDLLRSGNREFMYGNFMAVFQKHLSTSVIASFLIKDKYLCPFKCIAKSECFSYNLAAYPDNGWYICELLNTDMYRARTELKTNVSFHHFSRLVSFSSSCMIFRKKHGLVYELVRPTLDHWRTFIGENV